MSDILQTLSQPLKVVQEIEDQKKHLPFNVVSEITTSRDKRLHLDETAYVLTFEEDFSKYALWREIEFFKDDILQSEQRFVTFTADEKNIENSLFASKIVPEDEKDFVKLILFQAINLMEGKEIDIQQASPPRKRKTPLTGSM